MKKIAILLALLIAVMLIAAWLQKKDLTLPLNIQAGFVQKHAVTSGTQVQVPDELQ